MNESLLLFGLALIVHYGCLCFGLCYFIYLLIGDLDYLYLLLHIALLIFKIIEMNDLHQKLDKPTLVPYSNWLLSPKMTLVN
jgi:hypothetical protein